MLDLKINPILLYSILFTLLGCNSSHQVEGDLFFKIIDLRFHEFPDSTLNKIEQDYNSMNWDSLPQKDHDLYKHVGVLITHDLLRKPFIYLRKEDGDYFRLYLSKTDYKKFEKFIPSDLQKNKEKVKVISEVKVIQIDTLKVFVNTKLKLIEKTKGTTHSKK